MYEEAEMLVLTYLKKNKISFDTIALHEAIELNKNLVKLPFQIKDQKIILSHNIWEFYKSVLSGTPILLEKIETKYLIDKSFKTWNSWETWAREVVWWCNKKGAYMYTIKNI